LRIVFFGTPDFAVPTLDRLLAGPHRVVGVVTQPDRRRGRGRRTSPCPVAGVAQREGLPLLQPERAIEAEDALRELAPDLGVVVAFGQFLTKRIRELPRLGYLVNGHASLLPKLRGAAPIARAILDGERATGVSVMRVEREMDAGPVALQRELPIGDEEDAGALAARVAALTAEAVAEVVDAIAGGGVTWHAQDDAGATFAPKIEREDARIDWNDPAAAIARRVRAMAPSPGAATALDGEALRILAARTAPGDTGAAPGTVGRGPDGALRVATGDGWLLPLRLQRAGGKAMDTEAYLRGRPIPDGAVFE